MKILRNAQILYRPVYNASENRLLLLTKLLEDGTTLYRAGRLAEAAHRSVLSSAVV